MGKTAGIPPFSCREGKYLTFRLGHEEYGVGIMNIKEIIGLMPITTVPQTPRHVKGVINLRGKVIPVVDLRLKFEMEEAPHNDRTCIIVLDTATGSSALMIGAIVDSVSEVLNIREEEIDDAPDFGASIRTDYMLGMAKSGGGVKILLDIDRVLSGSEVEALTDL